MLHFTSDLWNWQLARFSLFFPCSTRNARLHLSACSFTDGSRIWSWQGVVTWHTGEVIKFWVVYGCAAGRSVLLGYWACRLGTAWLVSIDGSNKVDCFWNVMAHAQKPDFVFRRNGRVHLSQLGASVQSTTGSRGVCISDSNAGYTMFRGSVKGTGYPLHSPVSPSLPLPCVTVCHHSSTGL